MQEDQEYSKKVTQQLEKNLEKSPKARPFAKQFSSLFQLNQDNRCVLPAANVPTAIAAIIRQAMRVVSCDPSKDVKEYASSYENTVGTEIRSLE